MSRRWLFAVDRGGTFTDCVGFEPATGRLRVAKVLSGERAPIEGIRRILGLRDGEEPPPCDVRLGTTLATNALLERRGEPCAFVVTRGFADLLEIGTQARPQLFELAIHKPSPLHAAVVETDARRAPDGAVVAPVDEAELQPRLRELRDLGLSSVAVAVLHDHRDGALERAIGGLARGLGFGHVALSHELSPEPGFLARAAAAVLDAYLTPTLARHAEVLARALPRSTLRFLLSDGGLVDARRFRGPDAAVSGPAGGVVALAALAERAALGPVIGLDMGGTSADVSHYAGAIERVHEGELGGVRVRAPRVDLHTIAAGGGSLCRFDGVRATVGPESAGATPGPLCYGHADARELTLTDLNLALGRLAADRFPIPLDASRVHEALCAMGERLEAGTGARLGADALAAGFIEIADTAMAEAIRCVTVARGHDPRQHTLVVFGGAAGQHACGVARRLGVRRLVSHPLAGALSALGVALARPSFARASELGAVDADQIDAEPSCLEPWRAPLQAEAVRVLVAEGVAPESVEIAFDLDLRYRGTEQALTVSAAGEGSLRARFEALHRERFGWARPGHGLDAVVLRARAEGPAGAWPVLPVEPDASPRPAPLRFQEVVDGEGHRADAPVYVRETLGPGARIEGPALILEALSTFFVDRGFVAEVSDLGLLDVRDEGAGARVSPSRFDADPLRVEVFQQLFMSIADQMGEALRRTAFSTNIRERLDFSCALFDEGGGLVANAPHIPVHLGAMGETVRAVRRAFPEPAPGDVFVTNDPAAGGSHLPDVTVITPIHDARGRVRFHVGSRGHHADVGGLEPGSMPASSRALAEEGIVIPPTRLVSGGVFDEAGIRARLASPPLPARRIDENVADLVAQLGANATGAALLRGLCERHGADVVEAAMVAVQDCAARSVGLALEKLEPGERVFADALDDGTPIRVRVTIDDGRAEIDFEGTGPEHGGNLNAPPSVVRSAVLYALRCLAGGPLPLNDGCLRPVTLKIPPGSLLSPSPGRAVVAGNVETSQRIVDVLLGALGLAAASQGTMNNLSFGDSRIAYYETIAGGAGAGPGFDGASAIHTHMTNTRITDPEILEARYPVRLVRFAVRRGSGGAGRWRGGDGVVRELELLAPLRISIVSERRIRAPFGLDGGAAGLVGRNFIDGIPVSGRVSIRLSAGARVRIETPGGGGYGVPWPRGHALA